MKRLLVYMMVVGMASAANAGMVSVTGAGEVPYDGWVRLTVSYSGTPDIISFDVVIWPDDTSKATLGNVIIIADGRNSEQDHVGDLSYPDGAIEVSATADEGALGTTWFTVDLTGSGNLLDVGSTVTVSTADVICYDTDWAYTYPTMGSLEVTIVPEPVTIALLSLGGLLMRRRRGD